MSGLGKSGRAGIPNKNSLVARAEMDRLGINPIEMLKRVFDDMITNQLLSSATVRAAKRIRERRRLARESGAGEV